ncbi:MAG: choice-of-anchor B family protein, partial [Saprospiraceae bacterium]|nr:choice-of-anchor B family protein [Saprospiraceae bacterium]
DVTDKSSMVQVSSTGFPDSRYIHQGWATEDHRYFLVNDEFDESNNGHNTRTHIFDIQNLAAPTYVGHFEAETAVTDHNLYVVGNRVFQANYQAGLQIFELTDLANAELTRVGYFDTYAGEGKGTIGSWSVYPFFGINKILVSNMDEGLFVLDYNGSFLPIRLSSFEVALEANLPHLNWVTAEEVDNDHFEVERSRDGSSFEPIGTVAGHGTTSTSTSYHFVDVTADPGIYYYRLRQVDLDGTNAFSEIKRIEISDKFVDELPIAPNPVQLGDDFRLMVPAGVDAIQVSGVDGKVIQSHPVLNAGWKIMSTQGLSTGMYWLTIESHGIKQVSKLIVSP